ncbi:coiled-coil domain-containing protein 137-like [Pelobates fuscus]|uniref:coiled-coil domain-containing protein 137-like n=1 Tax=Pelobates fuscus TaxID=191477 RepID=UPI002FE44B1F
MGKHRVNRTADKPERPGRPQRSLPGPGQPHSNMKKKTNSAPRDLDLQEIPFKLREIMKSKLLMGKKKPKKKKRKERLLPLNDEIQTKIPIPKFKRRKRECVGAYLDRMEREVQHVIFLSKNQPDVIPELEVPKEETAQQESPSEPQEKSQKKKAFHMRKENKASKKKEENEVNRLEMDMFKDPVMFGEVVMEPPTLTAKPRKSITNSKPGTKSLLLKKLFAKEGPSVKPPPVSMARKRMIQEERERVIDAYRQMKKKKLQKNPAKGL